MKEYLSDQMILPRGLILFIYEGKKDQFTYIKADWMKSHQKIFYHMKGNVIFFNSKGIFLKTEEIFWDRKKKYFFNKKKTTVYNKNGLFFNATKGIEFSDNLNRIKLNSINGVISMLYNN